MSFSTSFALSLRGGLRRSSFLTLNSLSGGSCRRSNRKENACTALTTTMTQKDTKVIKLTPLSLSSNVLIQIEGHLILLELKLQLPKRLANHKCARLRAQSADLRFCNVLACESGTYSQLISISPRNHRKETKKDTY